MNDWLVYRWEKAVGAHTRFYEVRLEPDLWNQWLLVTVWGRRGAALGQVRQQPLPDYATGLQRLEQVSIRRRQRGYHPVWPAQQKTPGGGPGVWCLPG